MTNNGGLSRLLRDREPGQAVIRDRCDPKSVTDAEAMKRFQQWESHGGAVVEQARLVPVGRLAPDEPPKDLRARHFHRHIDTSWRRTSYSGLVRSAQEAVGSTANRKCWNSTTRWPTSLCWRRLRGPELASPMADLPTGAKFGSLVHAVLETADPQAVDLEGELREQIDRHSLWWPVDVSPPIWRPGCSPCTTHHSVRWPMA